MELHREGSAPAACTAGLFLVIQTNFKTMTELMIILITTMFIEQLLAKQVGLLISIGVI